MSDWLRGIVTVGQDVFDGPEAPGGAVSGGPHLMPRHRQSGRYRASWLWFAVPLRTRVSFLGPRFLLCT